MAYACQVTELPKHASRACSVGRAIRIIGDARVLLAMREIFFGHRRFDEIQAALDAPRATVAERLAHLVGEGLVERRKYQDRPPRFEYRLTEMGRDLYPSIVLLMQWGDRWLSPDRPPPLLLKHGPCGHPLRAVCTCSACSQPLQPKQVMPEPGPGLAGTAAVVEQRRPRRAVDPAVFERRRPCSVARSLGVIGDRWTFLILREAFLGSRRFDAFGAGTGAATNIVADRLADLVTTGVLERSVSVGGGGPEYRLTAKGLDLYPTSLALLAWGDQWLAGDEGAPMLLRHTACGSLFTPTVTCEACGERVTASEVSYEMRYAEVRPSAAA